jgi:hypothetical protein
VLKVLDSGIHESMMSTSHNDKGLIMNLYEVSTKHPITGEAWDLENIVAPSAESLESMPLYLDTVMKLATLRDDHDLTGYTVWNGNEFERVSTNFWPQLVTAGAV